MPFELDQDSPELTVADFAKLRPAAEILPTDVIQAFRRAAGRPKAERPKVSVTLRLDARIVEGFKAGGPGWQTRINDALAAALPR